MRIGDELSATERQLDEFKELLECLMQQQHWDALALTAEPKTSTRSSRVWRSCRTRPVSLNVSRTNEPHRSLSSPGCTWLDPPERVERQERVPIRARIRSQQIGADGVAGAVRSHERTGRHTRQAQRPHYRSAASQRPGTPRHSRPIYRHNNNQSKRSVNLNQFMF